MQRECRRPATPMLSRCGYRTTGDVDRRVTTPIVSVEMIEAVGAEPLDRSTSRPLDTGACTRRPARRCRRSPCRTTGCSPQPCTPTPGSASTSSPAARSLSVHCDRAGNGADCTRRCGIGEPGSASERTMPKRLRRWRAALRGKGGRRFGQARFRRDVPADVVATTSPTAKPGFRCRLSRRLPATA